jgi:hypothetical protein
MTILIIIIISIIIIIVNINILIINTIIILLLLLLLVLLSYHHHHHHCHILIIITINIIIIVTTIDFFFIYLRSLISMISDWVSFLAYPNFLGIKGFIVVVFKTPAMSFRINQQDQPNISGSGCLSLWMWFPWYLLYCPSPPVGRDCLITGHYFLGNIYSFSYISVFKMQLSLPCKFCDKRLQATWVQNWDETTQPVKHKDSYKNTERKGTFFIP